MKKTIILLVCTMILLMAFDSIVTTQNAYASEAASEVVGDSQTSSLPIDESLPYIELLPISSNKSSEISLKWNTCESDAVKRYEIYRSNHENDGYKLIAKVSDVNVGVFTDKNVNRNTKYFYRIRCCSDTCAGYFSVPVSGASSMEKTRGVSVRHINRSSLRISWSVSSEISVNGYQIYRSNTKNGKYVRIANISGRKRVSYTDKGLKTNKSYFYKVRGRSSVGYTPYSDIVSGSATRYLPIRAIRVRRVGSAAELSWNKSSEKR